VQSKQVHEQPCFWPSFLRTQLSHIFPARLGVENSSSMSISLLNGSRRLLPVCRLQNNSTAQRDVLLDHGTGLPFKSCVRLHSRDSCQFPARLHHWMPVRFPARLRNEEASSSFLVDFEWTKAPSRFPARLRRNQTDSSLSCTTAEPRHRCRLPARLQRTRAFPVVQLV
jgi:hypothetical protein